MITANSRYADSPLVVGSDLHGNDVQVITSGLQWNYTIEYNYHTVESYETIEMLAWEYFQDPTLWWQIADANPEILSWDSSPPPGYQLRIPALP